MRTHLSRRSGFSRFIAAVGSLLALPRVGTLARRTAATGEFPAPSPESPASVTTFQYDDLGRIVSITYDA